MVLNGKELPVSYSRMANKIKWKLGLEGRLGKQLQLG
jgi:hypothetical protein